MSFLQFNPSGRQNLGHFLTSWGFSRLVSVPTGFHQALKKGEWTILQEGDALGWAPQGLGWFWFDLAGGVKALA